MSPELATLTYKGWFKLDGVKERISGKTCVGVNFYTNTKYPWEPGYPQQKIWREGGLILMIGDNYASIGFAELGYTIFVPQDGGWTPYAIPAAERFRLRVKVI